ncbi:VOC family protein [Nocardia seriolae]|uniref:Biphenyl-2,3-diol 1,2-dioxygenase n=1 Tax=Nocardia seriolae TaxID=37332 RepID=A0A0B8N190_9NOCA|nr:VOC family protein [Nocardia seriolae]APB00809.1 Biphenyl-2,3-diol 1,2-dioxygenase [Nocardia seriolae]MTJ65367.1 2,3-dihydroxybiphenyl 1,2-dioxygenase [Nocardia seriolae]MTJ71866.1 2,3-dihydroxybiphenyl 1,2-dioxygenase [Nocardia seriolae]MTJ90253.1 2,3-dihydroxybiphenyl 1,2-dioxygenase [Nocardia seriolae]MTK34216.1 2,3-dihydroxybiphenyl 1,2-dioxygenase [Nocardia seriolae]
MAAFASLGYVRARIADVDAWRRFAFDTIGFAEGTGPNAESVYLRVDEHTYRFELVPGERDEVIAVGWQVADRRSLELVRETLEKAGVAVSTLSVAEAVNRHVEEAIAFVDPSGFTIEVFHGPLLDHSPVVGKFGSRFVTGDLGLGHVVLPVRDIEQARQFYTDVLGFASRGSFRVGPPEHPIWIRFMGVNPRHHSLALIPGSRPDGPGIVHVMVEVDSLDDVGRALDRVNKAGYHLSSTLGRHTNDKMISFYVRTPGNWDLEFGCDGMLVGEDYVAEEMTADSYWGHEWARG